jgi:VWFA-related protein
MTVKASAVAIGIALAAAGLAADAPEKPHDVGLVERASTRLAQIDVTVSGPKSAIAGLTAADFEVRVNRKLVPGIVVDDLCLAEARTQAAAPADPSAGPAAESKSATPAASVGGPRETTATYILYFDMPHLTQTGRRGAIDAARDMLPKLLASGHRAMLVVNANALKTVVPLTSDAKRLDAALLELTDDQSTFDPFSVTEENRLSDIVRELDRGVDFALALARRYAADERWKQERDLRRLSMVLGRLAEIDPPKAVLYFADTMRENAGQHYLSFFSGSTIEDANGKPTSEAAAILADAATGALPLDRVINESAALGIRFYTVEGQGMTGTNTFIQSHASPSGGGGGGGRNTSSMLVNSQRTRDAQGTLVSLAAETGGRSFLNGISPGKMAAQILDDMSCLYLLSFDPAGFPQDAPLSVSVAVNRPKVKVVARGRLVIQSDSARLTARVLSAFASPEAVATADAGVRVGVIPIDYRDGKFRARVQVAMNGSAVPITTWDLGASVVSQGIVRQDGSGRIQVTVPNTPVVYEEDMDFSAGDYDLIAVAHEVETDTLASKEVHGRWPKIDVELASLGPIAVSQSLPGGFLRNGVSHTQGAVIVGEDGGLRGDVGTAVISLVCRAKDQKRPLKVVRTLAGEEETPVGTTELDLTTSRCAQVVDLIPPKSLGAGVYRFIIAVSSEGRELTRGERKLVVPEKPAAAPAGAS